MRTLHHATQIRRLALDCQDRTVVAGMVQLREVGPRFPRFYARGRESVPACLGRSMSRPCAEAPHGRRGAHGATAPALNWRSAPAPEIRGLGSKRGN